MSSPDFFNDGSTPNARDSKWFILQRILGATRDGGGGGGGGDLLAANNLSDLANIPTARANLSVYSIAQIDAALASKAASGANSDLTSITGLTGTLVLTKNVAATPDHGFLLTNTTAAAVNAQKYSPAQRFTGQGWKTAATAGSQPVDFRVYLRPIQGSANPTGQLVYEASINGGAFSELMTLGSGGDINLPSGAQIIFNLGQATLTRNTFQILDENAWDIINMSTGQLFVLSDSGAGCFSIDRAANTITIDALTEFTGTVTGTSIELDFSSGTHFQISLGQVSTWRDLGSGASIFAIDTVNATLAFDNYATCNFANGLTAQGSIDTNASYLVNSVQVVGAQQSNVAHVPTGGSATASANADAINAILDGLEAHGLFAV